MPKHNNQFTDKFKYLADTAAGITGIKTKVTNVLNRLLPNRVLSRANIFNFTIDVTQDLANTVLLHVEDSLVEQNILIAQKESSVRGLATLSGHDAVRPMSSRGIIKVNLHPSIITTAGPRIIFKDAKFKSSENNLVYVATNDQSLSVNTSDGSILFHVTEGNYESIEYVADGRKLEKISIDTNGAIEHSYIKIWVNGKLYSKADSLYDMKAGGLEFIVKNGIGSQIDVVFGDGVFGRKLNEADHVMIQYLVTSGELGNIEIGSEMTLMSGCYTTDGNALDLNSYASISAHQGFKLGSNGEHIETTRNLAGYNSRAMVFVRPENLKAYLSRLSILSHIDVWTEQDDMIYNVLLLPNIMPKLSTYSSYFMLDESDMKLSLDQKSSIKEFINTSGSQVTSTEIVLKDPEFEKYVAFIYIDAQFIDKHRMKADIQDAIGQIMLESTFLDVDMNANGVIAQSKFLDTLIKLPEINQINIDIISERNELARINGFYETTEIEYVGSVKKINKLKKLVQDNENPNLGFTELGGIQPVLKTNIPLMRGGFMKYNGDLDPVLLEKSLYIFYKTDKGYEEL
jgi:hypothetical protein